MVMVFLANSSSCALAGCAPTSMATAAMAGHRTRPRAHSRPRLSSALVLSAFTGNFGICRMCGPGLSRYKSERSDAGTGRRDRVGPFLGRRAVAQRCQLAAPDIAQQLDRNVSLAKHFPAPIGD